MPYNFNLFKTRTKDIEDWLAKELSTIRTGRATPALLDGIQVDAYGSKLPLKQAGSVNIEDARTLRVTLWDQSQVRAVESAIAASNLGVSAVADGATVRVTFPELTADKRKVLLKVSKDKVEVARVSLRQERERVWGDIQDKERAGEISEDDKFRFKEELQKLVDEENRKLEAAGERKEKEISS